MWRHGVGAGRPSGGSRPRAWTMRKPSAGLLSRFVALADATPKQIEGFAKRNGVLGLVDGRAHTAGLAWGRPPLELLRRELPTPHQGHGVGVDSETGRRAVRVRLTERYMERLDDWRAWAAKAGAIRRIAADLRGGVRGGAADWRPVDPSVTSVVERDGTPLVQRWSVDEEREALSYAVSRWLWDSDARLAFGWVDADRVGLTAGTGPASPHVGGLLVGLGLLLALDVAHGKSFTCAGCGKPHERSGPPRRGRRAYCSACRASGVPLRDAKRDERVRRKRTAKLRAKQRDRS